VEYLLLRTAPEPWTAEDVILVVHAMFLELTPWGGEGDLARATMQEIIPPEVTAFLGPTGSEFDAPVEGEPLVVPPMPGPDVMDLRAMAEAAPVEDAPQPGSNAWAVAGSRTAHGGALLANDMHLGLGVPNTWYRVRMQWSDDAGAEHDVVGVTLPGAPLLIVGSTGRIAWGFTNSYIDTSGRGGPRNGRTGHLREPRWTAPVRTPSRGLPGGRRGSRGGGLPVDGVGTRGR
jgi:penicillin amidase